MNLRILTKASQSRNRKQSWPIFYAISRSFSNLSPQSTVPSFGVAFDIDGVVLRGEKPIGGSPQALKRLYHDSGGGFRESIRALELSQLLGLNISSAQVVQGHTPFKQLVNRYENDLVVAVGKGEPASVMSEYGFKNVISIDDYASCFEDIDPLASYKRWITKQPAHQNEITNMVPKIDVCSQRVHAAFVVSDSVDWSRDIQVLCDILRTGGHPGRRSVNQQPQLYFANDDLAYQAAFPAERLGMGAFRIALESVFNGVHPYALEYTSYGKPNPSVFKNAEIVLKHLVSSLYDNVEVVDHKNDLGHHFKTLYMIGDNPSVDINGAKQAGHPWFSILTRSGVFKEKENHAKYPADLVVDTVEEAVDYILTKECISESGKLH